MACACTCVSWCSSFDLCVLTAVEVKRLISSLRAADSARLSCFQKGKWDLALSTPPDYTQPTNRSAPCRSWVTSLSVSAPHFVYWGTEEPHSPQSPVGPTDKHSIPPSFEWAAPAKRLLFSYYYRLPLVHGMQMESCVFNPSLLSANT